MIMFDPLRKYAMFSGRACRKEFWLFNLFTSLVYIASFVIEFNLGIPFILLIVALGIAIPSFAVLARRLHDIDKSAWWILAMLIPIVNLFIFFILLVFCCMDGTKGDNRFGSDPKRRKPFKQ